MKNGGMVTALLLRFLLDLRLVIAGLALCFVAAKSSIAVARCSQRPRRGLSAGP